MGGLCVARVTADFCDVVIAEAANDKLVLTEFRPFADGWFTFLQRPVDK